MLNPLDAPDRVSAAVEPLEELLDDCNHVSSVYLVNVVPVAGTAPGGDWMRGLARAVYDAGAGGHPVTIRVEPFESARAWRDILHREVTDGFMQPANRYVDPTPRSPAAVRRAGELADGVADLVEAHLGPVLSCGDVSGPGTGDMRWRDLLLVTRDWATVLHLGICD